MEKLPLASIIVPTYNDENSIELCLRTLMRQKYPLKEIIVVNDGSTDNTANVLSKMAKECPLLRMISVERRGAARARNIGLRHAEGEVVFFGEGDAIYSKDYLAKAVEVLATNPELGGVCLTGAPWIVKSTFVTECIDVENRIKHKLLNAGKIQPYYAWVYRKEAIEAVGGYDERLFQAEDRDLFLRVKKAGYSIGFVPGINWRHTRGQNTWDYIKRNYVGGKTRILYLLKHRKVAEFFQGVSLLWALVLALPLVLFFPLLYYMILFIVALLIADKMFLTLRFGWSCVKKKKYLFFIPLFSAIRYAATAVGYTHGFLLVCLGKFAGKSIN